MVEIFESKGSYGVRTVEYHEGVKAWEIEDYLNRLSQFVAGRNLNPDEMHALRLEGASSSIAPFYRRSKIPSSTTVRDHVVWQRLGNISVRWSQIEYNRKGVSTPVTLVFEDRAI